MDLKKTPTEAVYKNWYHRLMKEKKRLVKISTEKVVSNWLTMLPVTERGFELSKRQLWDWVSLRYCWEITNIPTFCPCGSKFDIQDSMNCKKGGFVSIELNDLRHLAAKVVSEVCKDTGMESNLLAVFR